MSDTSVRADITSRARAADSWDAGLHAESDVGPIDVGLSVEPEALGVIVDAPHLGQIRLAFDLDAQGVARLSSGVRRLADGREDVLQAGADRDHARLKAQLRALEDRAALLETERDEARDRAALVMEERRALEQRTLQLKAELSSRRDEHQRQLEEATARLEIEQAARLEAQAGKERLRDELEALRARAADGDATLAAELERTRADAADARAQLDRVTAELGDVQAARATLEEQLLSQQGEAEEAAEKAQANADVAGRLEARVAELEAALVDAQAQVEALRTQTEAAAAAQPELASARERVRELEASLAQAQATAARAAELETALTQAEARTGASASALAEAERVKAARIAELEQALADTQMASGAREAQLEQALLEAQQAAQAPAGDDAAVGQLQAEVAALQAQVAESHEIVKDWQSALANEQTATAEAREIARQLKLQHDQAVAERDEARGIARQLHQKLAGKTGEAPAKDQVLKLTAERDRLTLQVDALGRQLEGERTARARAVAERDALKERLAGEAVRTETDVPAVGAPGDPTTEPHNLVPSAKKKP